tara:strand:+ start:305 stop:607 length:303 start_codon:yes stop_codon:yes gene_type:complete
MEWLTVELTRRPGKRVGNKLLNSGKNYPDIHARDDLVIERYQEGINVLLGLDVTSLEAVAIRDECRPEFKAKIISDAEAQKLKATVYPQPDPDFTADPND